MAALVALLAWPGAAFGAPVNDDPFDPPVAASNLVPPDFAQVSNDTATTYAGEPLTAGDGTNGRCQENGTQMQGPGAEGSQATKTVWWSFTGTGGPLTISSYLSNFDTVLSVWILDHSNSTPQFVFRRCNDDIAYPDDLTSELVLPSVNGQIYYVQVGGCDGCAIDGDPTLDHGNAALYVYPPPPNDRRGAPRSIALNTIVTTPTWGALTDTGEKLTCESAAGNAPFAKTAWYQFTTPSAGTVSVDASGVDAAISLYPGTSTTALGCAFSPTGGAASLSRHLDAGTYLAQVGGLGGGVAASRGVQSVKVNFAADPPPPPPPVVVTPPPVVITEPPPQTLARVRSTFEHLGVWGATGRFTALTVRSVPAGATVRVTCKGKGCRKKKTVKKVRKATSRLKLASAMRRNNRLRPRALVEVRVTAPGRIGKVFQFRIRAYKPPVTKTLCLPPGAKKPTRCS